jgi:uncharacterized membrane protein
METIQGIALIAATLTMGLMAGVFGLYAHAIMPGLRTTDDRTFVGAFQAIDRAIINPLFMVWFFGALVFAVVAAALVGGEGSVLPWVAAAGVSYLVVVVITIAVNVPLNDAIKAAGDPDAIDVAVVRERFGEARWMAWNVVRAVLSTAAFGSLMWALVQYGRNVLA